MDRREFFQKSLIASVTGAVLTDRTLARGQQVPAAAATPATPRKLILDAYSRNLHWLRSPDEVAEAAVEMTCGGVMPTVGAAGTAHVDVTKVAAELPLFVNAIRKHGLRVKQIRGGNQTQ